MEMRMRIISSLQLRFSSFSQQQKTNADMRVQLKKKYLEVSGMSYIRYLILELVLLKKQPCIVQSSKRNDVMTIFLAMILNLFSRKYTFSTSTNETQHDMSYLVDHKIVVIICIVNIRCLKNKTLKVLAADFSNISGIKKMHVSHAQDRSFLQESQSTETVSYKKLETNETLVYNN